MSKLYELHLSKKELEILISALDIAAFETNWKSYEDLKFRLSQQFEITILNEPPQCEGEC